MAWSELKSVPNEYNDVIKAIDENILKLLMERKGISNGRRFFPPNEIVSAWAVEFDLDIPQINGLIHSLTESSTITLPNGPGKLINVLPIMKKSAIDGFEYEITHSMQHENGSIVFIEINQLNEDENTGHVRPKLLLDVNGEQEYSVHGKGAHGGGGHTQLSFMVIPRLPDGIEELKFRLIPYAHPMEARPKEIILDKEVSFE
ncbi:hypothetical protein [Paenibacillus eucommiae]|uniref:DUF5643 domain-containing protein n=1 Tax=Paenibacillus eucommiae TaxID=1355755 RepID=A0ABS4J3L4_9BACL|nr:hypothetical protein [Paenibacillus eucommiae]MBP1994395.1 hypothetical protein [Paenibacillus eucommiae]